MAKNTKGIASGSSPLAVSAAGASSNVTFPFAANTYPHDINGFGEGGMIGFQPGQPQTANTNSWAGDNDPLQPASNGPVVLTGLPNMQDQGMGSYDFAAMYGAGSPA